jgi:N-acetylglucosaminyl-diphospho-decaprenol L-rhamnosyltransferase
MPEPGLIDQAGRVNAPVIGSTTGVITDSVRHVDISVCIVNWNCRELLRGCLESLQRQPQGHGAEVIVVDNGSTDGAPEMVAEEFPEVRLVRNSGNVGFSRANNQAARLARGRYLFFLNNDTVIPPGALEELVDYADAHPGIGILGPRLRDSQGRVQVSYRQHLTVAALLHRTILLRWTGLFRRRYLHCRRTNFDAESTREVEVMMGAAMLLSRRVFLECGMWDEKYTFGGEDMDLCYRVGQRWPIVYHPGAEILHYGRASTREHVRFASKNIPAGFVRYLRKSKTSATKLLLYKCVVTLDAPLQFLANSAQFLYRCVFRQQNKATKSLTAVRWSWHFLVRGLGPFWKA